MTDSAFIIMAVCECLIILVLALRPSITTVQRSKAPLVAVENSILAKDRGSIPMSIPENMPDSWESIARTSMTQLIKAGVLLDEADRLLTAPDGGTEKWAHELAAWQRRKDAIVDCGRGG